MKTDLYVFQWISDLGGADTRLKELLILLKDDFNITCIPNDEFRLKEKHNTDFLDNLGIKYCMPKDLPSNLEGFCYANCNFRLFSELERIDFINNSKLKLLWSNDMMWTTNEELDAIRKGKVDCCLFTSPFHKEILGKKIFQAKPDQKAVILENYFDPSTWPYLERPDRDVVVCGKVSRDDFMKFSENFPIFYESATEGLPVSYEVMGWNKDLSKKYSWFDFSNNWKLLRTNELKTLDYFSNIDIFLYNCNHKFIENQSRAIIEAQLTGCPIVAPNKWNFPNMIWDQRTGFLWNNLDELRSAMKDLTHHQFRKKMGKLASDCTRQIWCDAESARRKFHAVLNYLES
jgi:glycosyltransferase involved in cell wall biosynthesis